MGGGGPGADHGGLSPTIQEFLVMTTSVAAPQISFPVHRLSRHTHQGRFGPCQRRSNFGSGTVLAIFRDWLVGEEDAAGEQVGFRRPYICRLII